MRFTAVPGEHFWMNFSASLWGRKDNKSDPVCDLHGMSNSREIANMNAILMERFFFYSIILTFVVKFTNGMLKFQLKENVNPVEFYENIK